MTWLERFARALLAWASESDVPPYEWDYEEMPL